jgi:acetyltransferase
MISPTTELERVTKSGEIYIVRLCFDCLSQWGAEHLREHIVDAVSRMSQQSRQQRFAFPVVKLSERQLDHLANLDEKDRVAWCAFIPTENGEKGIGLARYVRLQEDYSVAEFAVAVVDEFQGQGVGTELLGRLIESAKSNSIATLRGYVLAHNREMLALCRKFDAHTVRENASTLRADIRIQC